jgi:hypothetical protein
MLNPRGLINKASVTKNKLPSAFINDVLNNRKNLVFTTFKIQKPQKPKTPRGEKLYQEILLYILFHGFDLTLSSLASVLFTVNKNHHSN